MMFKNESNVVISKAQSRYKELSNKKNTKKTTSKQPLVQTFETSSNESSTSPETTGTGSLSASPTQPLIPSIEDQALNFFASNNLLQPSIAGRGDYQWLFQMLSLPGIDSTLRTSAYAVSLATLATARKSQSLRQKAQEHYTNALTSTNKALRDPKRLYGDSTLVSVILLGAYENFMFENHSLHAWMHHLKGAGMLFALRGEGQFNSNIVRQIFVQFYKDSVSKGIELGTPVPSNVARLYRYLTSLDNYTMHGMFSVPCV